MNIIEWISNVTGLDKDDVYSVLIGPLIFFCSGLMVSLISNKYKRWSSTNYLRVAVKAWLMAFKETLSKQIVQIELYIKILGEELDEKAEPTSNPMPVLHLDVISNYSDEEMRRVFNVTSFWGFINNDNLDTYLTISSGIIEIKRRSSEINDLEKNRKLFIEKILNDKKDLNNRIFNSIIFLRGISIIYWEFNNWIRVFLKENIQDKPEVINNYKMKDFIENILNPINIQIEQIHKSKNEYHKSILEEKFIYQYMQLNKEYFELYTKIEEYLKSIKDNLIIDLENYKSLNKTLTIYLNEPLEYGSNKGEFELNIPFTNDVIKYKSVPIAKPDDKMRKRIAINIFGRKHMFVIHDKDLFKKKAPK
jgi:hypothetical protein